MVFSAKAMTPQSVEYEILVLDDDEIILVALHETLRTENYRVVTTTSAFEALDFLRQRSFAVIISDQRMAEMTGLEFLSQAKEIQPHASRILITGVLTLKTVIDAINTGEIFRFIAKPWLREELLATIQNAFQRYEMVLNNEALRENTLQLNARLAETNADMQQQLRELLEKSSALDEANKALRNNFDHSLKLLHTVITAYDPRLGEETRATVELLEQMAETGQFSEEERRALLAAGWLHHIGLINLPRDLIRRSRDNPESLEENEGRLVAAHPIYGQTLADNVDPSGQTGAIIRSQHERWDGEGYPDNLAGEAIPLLARHLSVASFFVESGRNRESTIETILQESGKAFDPESVRLFLKATRMVRLPRKVRDVLLSELQPGMVLAKGIYSPNGLLLIPESATLNETTLQKIQRHNLADPINQRLLVYS
jgi:response regulator RpfG family c-di-GMP phosphodiesterase